MTRAILQSSRPRPELGLVRILTSQALLIGGSGRPEIGRAGLGGAPEVLNRVLKIDNAVLGGENYCKVLLHFGGRIRVGPGIGETIMTGTRTCREM